MNIQTKIPKHIPSKVKKAPVALEAYGFTIPLMNGGHRIWPPKFKRFIVEGIAKRELVPKEVAETCRLAPSVINQWRREIENLDKLGSTADAPIRSFTALGFEVLISNDGRRHWPLELKQYVVAGLANGELTLAQIAKSCDIERSMIYQWKQDIKRKAYEKSKTQCKSSPSFVEVKLAPEPLPVYANKEPIILRYGNVVLEIPSDHHAKDIAEIVRELGRLL